jgi:hypothetical protein
MSLKIPEAVEPFQNTYFFVNRLTLMYQSIILKWFGGTLQWDLVYTYICLYSAFTCFGHLPSEDGHNWPKYVKALYKYILSHTGRCCQIIL